ncbi:uncharacterized protein LOC133927702 [Phragmites australis]|uniref:uncharacterized protein LOC133927702 n=1 Tax=Phragmites australis TaxID=29695 RepID=UPI002D79DD77|nr:uncharacterized protein LOC133927702 [Phragmites australis]
MCCNRPLSFPMLEGGPPPTEMGSAAAPQSPSPKRRRADCGPKPSGPELKIPESRWQYRGPKLAPPKDTAGDQRRPEAPRPALAPEPSAPAEPEPQAPPCPESRAAAAPEPPAPTEPAPSTLRAGQMAAARASEGELTRRVVAKGTLTRE